MQGRSGVPTMGGIFLCGSILVTTALLADVWFNRYIQISLIVLVWMSGVGAIDDWLKLTSSQRKPGSRCLVRNSQQGQQAVKVSLDGGLLAHRG